MRSIGYLAVVSALALFGCATRGTAAVYPSGSVVYDSAPPYGIEYYPRYPYNGSYAYLVGDRWYVPYGSGWGYYRHEPPALYNYRAQRYSPYVYQAPPAYRPPTYVAPPAYHPPPIAAPPAYRPPPMTAPPAIRPPLPAPAPMPHVAPPPVMRAPPAPHR